MSDESRLRRCDISTYSLSVIYIIDLIKQIFCPNRLQVPMQQNSRTLSLLAAFPLSLFPELTISDHPIHHHTSLAVELPKYL